ncbi:MAG: hypothetical protein ACI9U2_002676 [Bradymonadia bacterium]|jgi:hypothetical protein
MRPLLSLLVLLLVGLPACEENYDPSTPAGALHRLRDAIVARDAKAVLAQTSTATHTKLAELHTLLKEQNRAIAEKYPEDQRLSARSAYPKGVLGAEDTGALFAALMAPKLDILEVTDGLKFGLSVRGLPGAEGESTILSTQAGESLTFVREDDKWVTTAFESGVQQSLDKVKMHQQTLTQNLKVFAELKRRTSKKAKAAAAAPGSDSK